MTTAVATPGGAPGHAQVVTKSAFRPDVEGLRAMAVLLVMVFHAGVPFVSGGFIGVDVFFVISGFLITGLLVREIERSGRVHYRQFYARRVRRLLPASTVVLLFIAAASWLRQPDGLWPEVAGQIIAATFFVVNWWFAAESTDYFAADAADSPVQHFWSLSVEEQFYLVWPTLLVVFGGLRLLRHWRFRQRLLAAMVLVFVPSLLWSMHLSAVDAGRAYFVTTTRLWELALGGMVALTLDRWRQLGASAAAVWTVIGVAMILVPAFVFDERTVFPGWSAVIPTGGTALVIAAGARAGDNLTKSILGSRPLVWIGGMSYSLYLWHWPFAVLAPYFLPSAGAWVVAAAVVVSIVPAWLSLRLVENPIRQSRALSSSLGWTLTVGLLCIAISLSAGLWLRSAGMQSETAAQAELSGSTSVPGAAVMFDPDHLAGFPGPAETADPIVPAPTIAVDDGGPFYAMRCQTAYEETAVKTCSVGNEGNPNRIALVGDSHAAHWFAPLARLAEEGYFFLQAHTKASCSIVDVPLYQGRAKREYTECIQWGRNLRDRLLDDPPDFVIATGSSNSRVWSGTGPLDQAESIPVKVDSLVGVYAELVRAGSIVIHLADTPDMRSVAPVPECVAAHRSDLAQCAVAREIALPAISDTTQLRERMPTGSVLVDMSDAFCLPSLCPAVIGGALVYRDGAHMTATFARTTSPFLLDAINEAIGQYGRRLGRSPE